MDKTPSAMPGVCVHCGGEHQIPNATRPKTQAIDALIEGTIDQFRTGWTYTHAGTPVAYVMSLDDPGNATIIPFDRWWSALRFAMVFAGQNGCEYVGGPKQ